MLAKSEGLLSQQEAIKERNMIERFIKEVATNGLATYGMKETIEAVESRQADTLLVSEDLPFRFVEYRCNKCGTSEKKAQRGEKAPEKSCEKCGSKMDIDIDEPLADEIIDRAKKNNIKVEVISGNTAEGAQFLTGFGGIGAFLRYRKAV